MKAAFCIFFISVISITVQAQQENLIRKGDSAAQVKHRKAWVKPVVGATYVGLVYLSYRYADDDIQKFSQSNKGKVGDFLSHTVTDMGLGRTQTIALGATAVTSLILKNKKLQATVLTWAGSLLLNSIVTDKLKNSFQRHRPNTGDPSHTFDWNGGPHQNASFPSAHTSNAFTTATVFATMYRDHRWVPPLAYGLATLVGLSRIYDNDHWASDVMAGAAIGFLSAKAMTALYKFAGKKITILPQAGKDYVSITLLCKL